MLTERLHLDSARPNRGVIAYAAECLRRGGLVAFPTETVYGLGAHALDASAVRRLFAAKGRPANDPVIVHVADLASAAPLLATIPDAARLLASRFWPGPLTLVLRRSPIVPDEVTAGLDTVAVRVPSHPVALALIVEAGLPVAAPSANLFSRPSPTTAAHVMTDLGGRIDLILDAGPTTVGVESTVVDLSTAPPLILRPGAVGLQLLQGIIPDVRLQPHSVSDEAPLRSPGMLAKHYSPKARVTLYEGDTDSAIRAMAQDAQALVEKGTAVALLAPDEDRGQFRVQSVQFMFLGPESDPAAIAQRLYGSLRECDDLGVEEIFVRVPVAEDDMSVAVRDRLRRAASHVVRFD